MSREMALAIRQLVQDRGISEDLIVKTIEDVLIAAYKRRFGTAENAVIRFNDDATDVTIYARKRIVAVVDDPVTEIGLDGALDYDDQTEIGDELLIEINPRDFDRVSIQSAKQRARQTLREIQRDTLYPEYENKVGEMIIGYVKRERNGSVVVDLGKTEGVMPRKYQSPREVYRPNDRIRALIYEVEKTPTGLQIILSRTHTQFVRKIFELEVPELYDGRIEIYKMVREPGYRTKMVVCSTRDDVDPVGACVGMRGARIQAVVRELEGEKIDVLKYDPDPAAFIRNALQPAEVEEVIIVDDATRHALAVVHDAQFSLAIGRQGLNVRLANRLVDWNIDVKTRAQVADMDLDGEKKREAAALFSEDEAQEIDRISELPGVTERIAAALAEQGVERIEDLVEMSDDQLAATRGLTSEDISTIRNLLDETVEIVEEDEMGEAPPPAVQADEPAAEPAAEPEPADDLAEEVEEITAVSELGLKQHVTDALAAAGVHQAEALMSMSDAELAGVPGLSPDDVAGIRRLIDESVVIDEKAAVEEPPVVEQEPAPAYNELPDALPDAYATTELPGRPTELPAPFRKRLPPLNPVARIERAEGGLEDVDLCAAMAKIDDVARLARDRLAVSGAVAADLLQSLGKTCERLQPSDIFRELAERWDHRLTPERLRALRPLTQRTLWRLLDEPSHLLPRWHSKFVARSVAGEDVPLHDLLLPPGLSDCTDPLVEDEVRRSKFAPDTAVLDPAYVDTPEDVTMFLRMRTRHNVDAAAITAWLTDLEEDRRHSAVHYLLCGNLRDEMLQRLASSAQRPYWLGDYSYVRRLLDDLDDEPWRCDSLLAALFPHRLPGTRGQTFSNEFFDRFQRWWDDDTVRRRVIATYEKEAWPDWLRQRGIANGLRAESHDHWLGLLVLGACRRLGLTQDFQHKGFLERSHSEGWWSVFMSPEDPDSWMGVLRTWQDRAVDKMEYALWMSLFPTIYQFSRYLSVYSNLLLGAGRRPEEIYNVKILLVPRVDDALTFAGRKFDAPPAPLDMGVHWVLRELVRLEILDGDHLLPDCWVPSRQVMDFLVRLGLEYRDGASNSDKARTIFEFFAERLDTDAPHLHRSFDIPLRHVASDKNLQRKLGLES